MRGKVQRLLRTLRPEQVERQLDQAWQSKMQHQWQLMQWQAARRQAAMKIAKVWEAAAAETLRFEAQTLKREPAAR